VSIIFDLVFVFFFSSRRRHTRFKCDWSSDVCSSDLQRRRELERVAGYDPVIMIGGVNQGRRVVRALLDIVQRRICDQCPELFGRSEERRVGKECRSRWWKEHYKKQENDKTTSDAVST